MVTIGCGAEYVAALLEVVNTYSKYLDRYKSTCHVVVRHAVVTPLVLALDRVISFPLLRIVSNQL